MTVERRGLALPAIRTEGGYFASKSPHDTAWGDLLLMIFTPGNGRLMDRSFGSGIRDFLFEPQARQNQPVLDMMLREGADTYCPQVLIDEVYFNIQDKAMQLEISFHLVTDDTVVRRLLRLNRDGIIRTLAARS